MMTKDKTVKTIKSLTEEFSSTSSENKEVTRGVITLSLIVMPLILLSSVLIAIFRNKVIGMLFIVLYIFYSARVYMIVFLQERKLMRNYELGLSGKYNSIKAISKIAKIDNMIRYTNGNVKAFLVFDHSGYAGELESSPVVAQLLNSIYRNCISCNIHYLILDDDSYLINRMKNLKNISSEVRGLYKETFHHTNKIIKNKGSEVLQVLDITCGTAVSVKRIQEDIEGLMKEHKDRVFRSLKFADKEMITNIISEITHITCGDDTLLTSDRLGSRKRLVLTKPEDIEIREKGEGNNIPHFLRK